MQAAHSDSTGTPTATFRPPAKKYPDPADSQAFNGCADPTEEVLDRVVTALCLAFTLWVVVFGGPVGEDGRLYSDAGKVAHLGY
jgi:hypothetical protein